MSAGASDVLLRLLRRAGARRRAPVAASGGMNVEEIEPRILHSADLAPLVVGDPAATQVEMRVLDAVPAPANDALSVQQKVRHELVIVDAATPDYRLLIEDIAARADATREIEVVLLEPGGDGLRQITDALAQRSDLDALHIISHGSDGALYLGRDVVDAAALARYAEQVASWSHALGADADILLYGCDVSASAQGRVFADTLARLTGADVAASDDLTGAAARGGDWALEYHAGSIETDIAFSAGALQSWQGILGNTAPTLSGANNLSPVTEDPATNPGTLVSSLIAGHAADADAAALTGIAVTAADNTNGAWQYSTDGASTWTGFGTPGASSARLLAADASTYVRFVPNANWNGSVVNGLTFRAWDQTSGAAGGTADTTVGPSTVRDNFNVASYSNNDGSASWSAAWVDSDGSATGGQIQVTSNRLEFDGGASGTSSIYREANLVGASSATLTFDFNNSVSPGTLTLEISSNGGASYTTLASSFASGAGSASFDIAAYAAANTRIRFTVVGDNGLLLGLGAGGPFRVDNLQIAYVAPLNGGPTAFSSAVASSSITVNAVNDAPAGTSTSVTTREDTAFAFSVASFGLTDPNDAPANALSSVRISALSTAGTLTVDGVAVTAGQSVSAADIAAGKLIFTPTPNANGAAYASFTFQVQDDGGIANGGVDLDPTPRTMTINVTAVNDAPTGTSNTVTTNEDTAYVFTAASFGLTDANDTPANALSAVSISALPAAGALTLNGVAVTAGQSVSAANIAVGRLVYTPGANASGAGYASFTFRVQDDGGTANGGVDLDPLARTMTINVTPVNDAPAGTSTAVTTLEDTAYVFTAASFGFTDANDTPANTLSAVRISTLPAAGALTLNGVAVAAGQFVSVAGISAGGLVFTPAANANGAGYSSFTFQVRDSGGTANGGVDLDPVARTMTINVTAVNDAPVLAGANNLTAINEDPAANPGTLVSALIAGRVSDADAAAASGIAVVGADNAHGAWQYSINGGSSWTSFGTPSPGSGRLLAADANTYVRFVPDAGWNGTVTSGLTFRAWDRTTGTNGSMAPTIPNPVWRDEFRPDVYSNNDGTATWSAAWVDSDADPDGGSIRVNSDQLEFKPNNSASIYREANLSGASSATLSFSFDNGFSGGDTGRVRLLVSANGGVSYTALADFSASSNTGSGTFSANIGAYLSTNTRIRFDIVGTDGGSDRLRVDDVQIAAVTPGSGGATAFSTATASSSITVNPVNDAPRGANNTVVALEDTTGSFTTSMFGFSDPGDSPDNNLLAVRIASLPTAGTLAVGGVAVSAGQSVAVSDILAGRLTFRAAPDANGNGYATFTFQVQDDGGTANGGVDLDTVARTMTINVTPVNDAPTGTSATVTTNEDAPFVFSTASFGFTDTSDSPANSLSAVRIGALPTAGSLTLNGAAVTAGQFVSASSIAAGRLVFTPAANANGTAYASFTFQVQDDGGTAGGGVNLDPTARTLTIDVRAVNDAPTGTDKTITIDEDAAYVLTAADFGYSDAVEGNALAAVRIGSIATTGSLRLNGVAVTVGQLVSGANIASGLLVFTPAANANGVAGASFTFQVQDSGGTANGGVDLDPTPNTITFNVNAVNDAPAGTSTTVTTNEDTAYTLAAADFGYSDAVESHAMLAVRISTLPAAGVLTNNGAAVVAGSFVSASDIAAGRLVFTPAANANGNAYSSFTFQVQDSGGTANGGIDLDPTAKVLTFNVNAVNDAPAGTNRTITTNEDTAYTLATADFGYSDAVDRHALLAVKIGALPAAGALTNNGVAVTAGSFVSASDIAAGRLVFTPVANANGAAYASFTFQVQDNGGTANGGVDLDPGANILTFDVNAVNDAPAGTNKTVTLNEDAAYTLRTADFGYSDAVEGHALLAVRIGTLPVAGGLTNNGVGVAAGSFVSATDIAAGRLVFSPAANANGAAYASFTFQVQDSGGTANGGVDLDPSANTLTFNVNSVNDAPAGTSRTLTTTEDTPLVLAASDFGFSDTRDSPADAFTGVRIAALPTAGSLKLNGVAVNAGQLVSIASIDAGNLVYAPAVNANGAGYARFTFRVQDGGGTANGGVNLDPIARAMTIDVAPVDDAPVGTSRTAFTPANTALVFDASFFGFSDSADVPANNFTAVRIDALPSQGLLTLSGTAVVAGQSITAAALNAGALVYTPGLNGTGAAYASFTFRVQDDGAGANLDVTARTMTVNVGVLNKAPAGAGNALTTLEDTPLVFTSAVFGFTDPDDSPANAFASVRIGSLPVAGSLTLGGAAVAVGDFVRVADIDAGRFAYTPDANASGAGYASFDFQVNDDGAGVTLDPVARTLAISVVAVNDAPSGADRTVAAVEDAAFTLSAAAFGFSDLNDTPAGNLLGVQIAALPTAGTLTLNGAAVTAGQFITAADLDAGRLKFAAAADSSGVGYASLTFHVRDDGGTANGGADLDAIARTLTFNVAPVNDAPAGADGRAAMTEDTPLVLTASIFGFSDGRDSPANALSSIRITTLPTSGSLTLNGTAIVAGQFVSVADVDAGRLTYTAPANAAGTAIASFTFQVRDDGGVLDGGVDLDPVARTLVFDATPVNDPPRGADTTTTVIKDSPTALSAAAFGFSDPQDSPANRLAAVRIVTLPSAGLLTLGGAAVTAGQQVAAGQIDSGALVFTPAADAAGAAYAQFTFQVTDDGGGADTDPVVRIATIDVREPVVPRAAPIIDEAPVAPPEPALSASSGSTSSAAAPAAAPAAAAPAPSATSSDSAKPAPRAPVVDVEINLSGPVGLTAGAGEGSGVYQSPSRQAAAPERPSRDQREIAATFVPLAQSLLSGPVETSEAAAQLVAAREQAARSSTASLAENRDLGRALDMLRDGLDEQSRIEATAAAASASVGVSLSVGYVVWLLRGGVVLSSLLSSLPAWRMVDPLPVLGRMDDEDDDESDESLESLVARNNAEGAEAPVPGETQARTS
ncbi:MAG: hypothetical protein JWO70_1711 [Betaproteobacteria bacterium]|nr:hypothetical protein [Betaproteobacteria bacterium]